MHYKTITLNLLAARPILREQLETHRLMMPALNYFAAELKASHRRWMEILAEDATDGDRAQLSSEALELAIEELRERLPAYSQLSEATFSPEQWREQLTTRSSAD